MQRENERSCYKKSLSSPNTHHSSSRSVSMRDIVVGGHSASLYPGLQISGMTSEAGGFTLIELLVVVLIIGILASVALPQYRVAVAKSRLSALIPIVDGYKKSLELYYLSNGEYPRDTVDDLGWAVEAPSDCGIYASTSNGMVCSNGVEYDVLDFGVPNVLGMNTTTGNGYLRWAEHSDHPNETRCLAVASNNVANQVCKSMGGQEITGETYRWATSRLGGTLKVYKL